ncbi:MAG TPA: hypothetical protein VFG20_15495 [Planctomycetaceae bacterium]|nr:hypothetical protein [Planctomycetaceae bacterium]
MRLTLRTLLAYLDDTLEPAETRELGRKIQESPVAAALVSRVREVIRKRRLGAPDVDGPSQGIDPNIVAQYLDNTLQADQVGQVEAVCLESDLVLAEVAACHQILSSVQGEPVDVPVRSLEHFYALGPVSAEAQLQSPRTDQAASPVRAAAVPVPARNGSITPVSESAGHFRDNLAGQLKTTNWSQRIGPAAGAALVITALVLVLMADRDLFRGVVKPNSRSVPVENAAVEPRLPQEPVENTVVVVKPAAPGTETTTTVMKEGPSTTIVNVDPTPPPDAPEPTPQPVPVVSDVADAATVVPKPVKPVITAPEPMPTPPAAPVTINVPIQSTGVEGVLLRFEPADLQWYVQPRRSEVHANETFASPEPYEGVFEWDGGLLKTTILPDTVVQVLPSTEERRYHLAIRRGRVILHPGPTAKGATKVALTIGGTLHEILLTTPVASVGVEVRIAEPAGFPPAEPPSPFRAVLYVISGDAQVDDGPVLMAKQFARIAGPATPDAATLSNTWPAWLDATRRVPPPLVKLLGTKFEEEFDPKVAVGLIIPALVKEPNPNLAELAARCVSLMESCPAMVQALTQVDHKEARVAAADGLRAWLALDPNHTTQLRPELEKQLPADEAVIVERLLWGFTRDQGQDKLISQELVDWLRSSHLVVRELSFQQIVNLTGRRNNYVPTGTASQREIGVQHWQNHLKREGALLKPDE